MNMGPRIVRSGLVLNLDAGQKTSYSGTGSSWRDLSGYNNGASYTTDLGNPSWANNITAITIMLWFQKLANYDNYALHPVSKWNAGYDKNASFILYHFGNYFGNYSSSEGDLTWYGNVTPENGTGWTNITAGFKAIIGNKYHVCLQYNNTSGGQMWSNGAKVGGRTAGGYNGLGQTSINSTVSNIGIQDGPEAGTYQKIHQIAFYNRELSDAEIVQNYNATKGRFGL